MSYHLGVDLGGTFVTAATAGDGRVAMCTLGERSVPTPAVALTDVDGTVIWGDAALRRGAGRPGQLERGLLGRLGETAPVHLGGIDLPIPSAIGRLLRDVLHRVTELHGAEPDRVVLAIPPTWGQFRRNEFEAVPRGSGLTRVGLVTAPEAAAAYFAAGRPLAEGDLIAVYDLGGTTFSATVLRRTGSAFEVLGSPEGSERIGGAGFDELILAHVDRAAGGLLDRLDPDEPRTAQALWQLRQDCGLAREALSVDTETSVPVFWPNRYLEVPLSRADFEAMIEPQIRTTIDKLDATLESAGVAAERLAAILLIGGCSRIPLVERMITERVGQPTIPDVPPTFPVALGAALLAGTAPMLDCGAAEPPQQPSAPPPPLAVSGASVSGTSDVSGTSETGRTAGSASWWPRVVIAAAALAGVAVLGYTAHATWVSLTGPPNQVTAAAPPAAAAPAPAPAQVIGVEGVATSVPIPSLGATIPAGPTPGFVVISPNGRQAYVANRNAGLITVIDTTVNQPIATINIPTGPPQYLAFAPSGRTLYASIWNDARTIAAIAVIDTTTNTVLTTIPVQTRPFLAAVTPNGQHLYVPNHDSGTITVIDTNTNKITTEIKVAPNPHWVEFSRDGTRAYTANHESNVISVLDTATNTVLTTIPVQKSPHSLAVHPTRPLVANVNYDANTVTMIDTNTNTVTNTIQVGKNPQDITWAPDGRHAYTANITDNTVSVINADTMTVTATLPTGKQPTSIAVTPNGTTAYVTNLGDNNIRAINITS